MKFTLFLAVVCAAAALINCERCQHTSDCSHTQCDSATTLGCSHDECTCLSSTTTGTCAQTTCADRNACSSCTCRDSRDVHHCFDGHCMCGRGSFFGPGGK